MCTEQVKLLTMCAHRMTNDHPYGPVHRGVTLGISLWEGLITPQCWFAPPPPPNDGLSPPVLVRKGTKFEEKFDSIRVLMARTYLEHFSPAGPNNRIGKVLPMCWYRAVGGEC